MREIAGVHRDSRRNNAALRNRWIGLVPALALFFASPAVAFEFVPRDAEFFAWPDYCKARYMTLPDKTSSQAWVRSVSEAEIARSRESLGVVFNAVHHYCAGTIWLNRARIEQDPKQKGFQLESALGEMSFTYRYTGPGLPLYSEVSVGMATVYFESRRYDEAMQLLEDARAAAPGNAITYSAMAVIYRSTGRLDRAKQTLLDGDAAVGGDSAEICYNLGLVELELGDPKSAVEYARRAYSLGYPLPGLKRKLERLGHWTASNTQ